MNEHPIPFGDQFLNLCLALSLLFKLSDLIVRHSHELDAGQRELDEYWMYLTANNPPYAVDIKVVVRLEFISAIIFVFSP